MKPGLISGNVDRFVVFTGTFGMVWIPRNRTVRRHQQKHKKQSTKAEKEYPTCEEFEYE